MNDSHRTVLQRHGPDLVKDLVVTEALLGSMYHKNIFDQEKMDIVRACQLPNDKVYKMLELIPKCGPEAFDSFIEILEEQYEWLARLLKETMATENERSTAMQVQAQIPVAEVPTPRATSSSIHLDSDIKSRASAFVQRQFGNVRKISMSDKKAIEKAIGEWLQCERNRLTKAFDIAASNVLENPQIKGKLWSLHKHICARQKKAHTKRAAPTVGEEPKINDSNKITDDVAMETDGSVETTTEDMTFDLIKEEINEMADKMLQMKKEIKQCYQYMGFAKGHQREVSIEVQDLCSKYRLKERELAEERRKIEKMLVELYEYSTSKNKMQTVLNNQEHCIRSLEDNIDDARRENMALVEEIKALERQHLIHLEKEQTLAELKLAQEGFSSMLEAANKQNEDLKKMVKDSRGTIGRFYQNKRPTNVTNNHSSSNINNKTISPAKTVPKRTFPKKKSQSFRA